jgi:hypothetical protein
MTIESTAVPAGTGQEGAPLPAGASKDIPIHLEGEPSKRLEHLANKAASKGFDRQQSQDPTEFTK